MGLVTAYCNLEYPGQAPCCTSINCNETHCCRLVMPLSHQCDPPLQTAKMPSTCIPFLVLDRIHMCTEMQLRSLKCKVSQDLLVCRLTVVSCLCCITLGEAMCACSCILNAPGLCVRSGPKGYSVVLTSLVPKYLYWCPGSTCAVASVQSAHTQSSP